MKIAYCRYNQNTDLDYALGSISSLGTELRVGILNAMIELGHEVTIVSYVSSKHRHALNGESVGDFDNTWMRRLHYDIDADIQKFDLLFVETAAGNSMYSFSYDGSPKSFVGHFADILYEAQGIPIVIYHHGPKGLAFPFSRLSCLMDGATEEYLETLSPNNYRNLFRGIDIFDGYEYHVWHHSHSTESFIDAFRNYYGRPEVKIHQFINTPMAYSPTYDKLYKPRSYEESEYDLVFVGKASTKYRIERILKFYDSPDMRNKIVGAGWDDVDFINRDRVVTPGKIGYHGDSQDLYQDGQACVLIANEELAKAGLATTRHMQTIRGGVFTMLDHDIQNPQWWMGTDEFVVSDIHDVWEMLERYCTDYATLVDVVNYQRSMLSTWVDIIPGVLEKVMK